MPDPFRQPLVSFVTRTCQRPRYLVANIESILRQDDEDWEQILLVDNVGRGLLYANSMFFEHQQEVNGKYVYILDDDNRLTVHDIVSDLRSLVKGNPPVVMCRAKVNDYVMPPRWQTPPVRGEIDAGCYFVRSDIWKKYIQHYAMPVAGDYHFIHAVWLGENLSGMWPDNEPVWWNRLVNESMRRRPYGETTDRAAKP